MKKILTMSLLGLLADMPLVRGFEKQPRYHRGLCSTSAITFTATCSVFGGTVGGVSNVREYLDYARTRDALRDDIYSRSDGIKPSEFVRQSARAGVVCSLAVMVFTATLDPRVLRDGLLRDGSIAKTLGAGAAGWGAGCFGGALYGAYEGRVQKKPAPTTYENLARNVNKDFFGNVLPNGTSMALYRSAQARKLGFWAGLLGTAVALEANNQLSNKE